jgi:hypothetical protein
MLMALDFQVLRREGFVDTYKCSCGNMEKYVEYQSALNHSYGCEKCVQMRARTRDSRLKVPAGVQCV